MEAMTARQSWSDDKIDGLEIKVDAGFARVDEKFEQVDQRFERLEDKVDKGFESVNRRVDESFKELRNELNQRLGAVDARFHSFQRTMVVLHGGIIAGLIGVIATQL
jgi:uncharacterized protein YdcH (DUF465 family)